MVGRGWGVDTRLSVFLASLGRLASRRVRTGYDVGHIRVGMHRMMAGARDEGPEDGRGLVGGVGESFG